MRDHSSSTGLLERRPTLVQTELADPITVPALTYTQVRMLAESAVGIDNVDAHFVFSATGLTRTHSNAAPDTQVLVPSKQKGRYPRLVQVGLQRLPPIELGPIELEGPTLNAVEYFADAVFWSDSAVKKFLVPYVASCGGCDAGILLQKLDQAWSASPGAKKVYALMHVAPTQFNTPLDLGNALWVVFADADGVLGAQPLDEFVPEPPSGGESKLPQVPVSVPYRRGSMAVQPQYPDYITLRAMAEYAASLASQPYYFVFRAGKKAFDKPISAELPTDLQPGDFVVPVQTPTVPADRPELGALWFQPEGREAKDIGRMGDAMFWSTGAIEQFMYPYYASKLGFAAPENLVTMRQAWDPAYVPPTPEQLAEEEGASFAMRGESAFTTNDTEVYALIHLPRSDWVTGGEAVIDAEAQAWDNLSDEEREVLRDDRAKRRHGRFTPLHEVGVVHRARKGAVNVLALADFKALFPTRFA
jgi:hypothetical protein